MLNQFNNEPNSPQSPSLEPLELANLFLHIKSLVKAQSASPALSAQQAHKKNQIQQTLQFIVEKLQNKARLPTDKFVAYISMLVYVNVTAQTGNFVLAFHEEFYANLVYYVRKIVEEMGEAEKGQNRLNLSILLCSLSSLVQQNAKNIINISLPKLFNPQLLKLLLTLQFPGSQKFLKYYRTLILYLSRLPLSKPMKKLYLKSLGSHLLVSQASKNTQISIIYLMNKCLEDGVKVEEVWTQGERRGLVREAIQVVLGCGLAMQLKLVLGFCYKVVVGVDRFEESEVNGQLFLKLYTQVYKNITTSDRLCPCLQQLLLKIPQSSLSTVFTSISSEPAPSTLQLQILQLCTKNLPQLTILSILESGYWQSLIFLFQETVTSNYKKYLLNKIIANIVKGSQANGDLYAVLRNLYELSIEISNRQLVN